MKQRWFVLIIGLLPSVLFALPRIQSVPGGISQVALKLTSRQQPQVYFQDKRVMVVQRANKQWASLVGLSLNLKPGRHTLEIRNLKQQLTFRVKPKVYPHSNITLADKKFVTPGQEVQKRIQEEAIARHKLLQQWTERDPFRDSYQLPVKGTISGRFGTRRTFNELHKEAHNGLDIHAKKGTPVYPCSSGIVLDTGDYYYSGKTVIMDHGRGILSLYAHLDNIAVKKGRHLTKTTQLGSVGQTGRATGPHLHWSVIMNQNYVNPGLFLKHKK